MNEIKKWKMECTAKEIVEVLNKKAYRAIYAEDLEAAKEKVLELIPKGAKVGVGGSVTLAEMGMIDTLRNGDYDFVDRYNVADWIEQNEKYREALLSDVFLTSTNAITKNGELVNVDCSGNRVSAMIYGPRKVIIVAGVNKVVDTLDDAMKRLKEVAPMNCKRLGHQTPCSETGECVDCQIQPRMCNYITIINHGMKYKDRFTVIIVPDEIGF